MEKDECSLWFVGGKYYGSFFNVFFFFLASPYMQSIPLSKISKLLCRQVIQLVISNSASITLVIN